MSAADQWTEAAANCSDVGDDALSVVDIEMFDMDRIRDLNRCLDDANVIIETGTVEATVSVQTMDANNDRIDHINAYIEPVPDYDGDVEWFYADRSPGLHERINEADLRNILTALGDDVDPDQFLVSQMHLMMSISSGVPVTEAELASLRPPRECAVCFETVPLSLRSCCRQAVCDECIRTYVETQLVVNGKVQITCPVCDKPIYNDEIRVALANNPDLRDRYDRWIVDMNGDPNRKTCPRCSRITEVDETAQTTSTTTTTHASATNRKSAVSKYGLKIQCVECQLEWCFPCQAPWHEGLTCKEYRSGDVLLKGWAKQKPRAGERNAQRCPKCKIYIQRTEGCDHMTCNRCNAEFCYRCGDYRRTLTLFGFPFEDHDWKHSIIGCREKYKPDRPVQRVLARGAIFSAKVVGGVIVAPVVVGLAASAAAIALPAYGTYRLAKTVRKKLEEADIGLVAY